MFAATYAILWFLIIAQSAAIFALIHEITELRTRVGREPTSAEAGHLPIGSPAPHFLATNTVSGQANENRDLVANGRVHVFLSVACPLCVRIAKDLQGRHASIESVVTFVVDDSGSGRGAASEGAAVLPNFRVGRNDIKGFRFEGLPAMVTYDIHSHVVDIRYPASAREIRKYVRQLAVRERSAPSTAGKSSPTAMEERSSA